MDLDAVFRQIMDESRANYQGTPDEFDYDLAVGGYPGSGAAYGGNSPDAALCIDNAVYQLANGPLRAQLSEPGDPSEDSVIDPATTPLDQRPPLIRKGRLRALLAPHMEAFVSDARSAKYTGWSRGNGPVRRVR